MGAGPSRNHRENKVEGLEVRGFFVNSPACSVDPWERRRGGSGCFLVLASDSAAKLDPAAWAKQGNSRSPSSRLRRLMYPTSVHKKRTRGEALMIASQIAVAMNCFPSYLLHCQRLVRFGAPPLTLAARPRRRPLKLVRDPQLFSRSLPGPTR